MRRVFVLGLALTLPACGQEDAEAEFGRRIHEINASTGARQLSVGALAAHEGPIVLLDVRDEAEHRVAALRGARRVDPAAVRDLDLDASPETLVVAYCTVGYRSGLAAVALERRLGRPVHNLDGGLIAWFNAGHEVVDPATGEPVERIDPYDDDWARFVNRPSGR